MRTSSGLCGRWECWDSFPIPEQAPWRSPTTGDVIQFPKVGTATK